jgi:hypothetical protein
MQVLHPGAETYAKDVRGIWDLLKNGQTVHVTVEDRATRYRIVLFPVVSTVFTNIEDRPGSGYESEGYWLGVALMDHGAYWFDLGSYLSPDFVGDKLAVSVGDGEVLSEFLIRLAAARRIHAAV